MALFRTAELVLDDVWVSDEQVLGTVQRGFYGVMKNFQNERMVLVGMGLVLRRLPST